MNRKGLLRYIFVAAVVAIVISAIAIVQVNARGRSVDALARRLQDRGVPIKRVGIVSQTPFQIEITLQSSSDNDELTLDDIWLMQLARREATMAYRLGLRIASYQLTVVNTRGDILSSEQNFLYPTEQSQQMASPAVAKIDNATTEKLILDQLDFSGTTLDSLTVTSDPLSPETDKFLEIQLSVPDIGTANKVLAGFMVALPDKLKAINAEKGSRLVLCHLRLTDRQGNVLLNYVRDLETGDTQWHIAEGITHDWFPSPPQQIPGLQLTPTPNP